MKRIGPVGGLDHGVDRVAGGAGQVVDDRALLADQAVEEGRLADVGPADDGDARDAPRLGRSAAPLLARRSASPREGVDDASSRSPAPRPCRALTGWGSPSPSARTPSLGLAAGRRRPCCDHEHWRLPRAAAARPRGVLLGDADRDVDDEQRPGRPRAIARSACWLTFASRSSPPGSQPPVSTSREGPAPPVGLDRLAVAGHAPAAPRPPPRDVRRCG